MSDDHESIRNLCHTYAFLLDDGDFAGVAELLADATLRPSGKGMADEGLRGREAIQRFYTDQVVTYRDQKPLTRHVISNHVIEIDGDAARSLSYFTVLQAPPRLPYQIVVGGRYHDSFARDGGKWHFTEKVIEVNYLNDISHHFLISAEHRDSGS